MLKLWWGICWRIIAIWVAFAIPIGLLYSLIEQTESTIKLKPTYIYLSLALVMLTLGKFRPLNSFIWRNIVHVNLMNTVAISIAALSAMSALLNFLLAYLATTETYINSKILLGFFMFIVSPFIVSFIIKFKEANSVNE